MFKKTIVKKSVYYDSVKLMLVTREIKAMEGVEEVAVVMGTDLNKETLVRTGLSTEEALEAAGTDMIVGVACTNEAVLTEIFEKLDSLLNSNASGSNKDVYKPKSVETAVKMQPGSNVCAISIPGRYAKSMAMDALRNNLHVMLFSDNVSMEEEMELKQYALKKDLLVMGPDCGTAIINGVPLCFANKVNRGNIGVVAASGTGAQEVTTLIHKYGGGLTQVIGTGGRDLKEEIGGITALQALRALNEDAKTEIITVVSKPPSEKVVKKILDYIKENVKKPVVMNFLGGHYEAKDNSNLYFVSTLEAAALKSLELAGVVKADYQLMEKAEVEKIAEEEAAKVRKTGKYIRGLFSGGTLGYEALFFLKDAVGKINSNMLKGDRIEDCFALQGNACIDLGDDEFTVGRAHPMIDSGLRAEIFRKELRDPKTAVILMDIVLGYGSNITPEKDFVEELAKYKNECREAGPSIIVSLCGSADDPQNFEEMKDALEQLGVVIMPSNLKATELATRILQLVNKEA